MTELVVCASCGTENPSGSRFCNGCGALLEAAAPTVETRKTVTILFIDATSSTALGERLDPESLRAVMTRYFDVMQEVIEFHGGSIEKFIGDAVMAVFGVPVVHEDDALRACRAAWEIHGRLEALDADIRSERGASVEWRMGINTGEVVAGDPGTGQRIVTGDAVNVAARLEAATEPGQILLGADTVSLVRGSVETEAVEALALKGKAERVPAWRLIGVTEETARHGHARPMDAPLVGRTRPMRLLDEAFREAVEERVCHLFTVLGVAGVGKSRLVDEFIGSVGGRAQVASGRCLAYGHGITYWPAMEAVRHGLQLPENADAEATFTRLRELLAGDPDASRIVTVIGHLMGFTPEAPAPSDIFWGIRRVLEVMARERPLVLVFDDIHWGETTFLDLIDHIAEWTQDAPILLIAMARPELLEKRPMWGGGKRWSTTVQLEPLSETESDELVAGLLGRAELPEEARGQISRAAEGNPLFVEELLGKLIDDGFLVRTDESWAAIGDLHQLALPPTIQALMAARLDSLGRDERTVIERASVEGKVFHRGAVTELAPDQIKDIVPERLATLTRMELLRPDQAAFAGEEAYRFRHLLIRDAAYQALAKQTRSELHERFAAWLERTAGERLAEYEEILGYHYEQAFRYRLELGPPDEHARSLANRAGALLGAAARRSAVRMDVNAATDLLDRVIELLPPDSPERWITLGQAAWLMHAAGRGAYAEGLLEETREAAGRAGDDRAAAWASIGLVWIRTSTTSLSGVEMIAEAERLQRVFEQVGDDEGASQAELLAVMSLFSSGRAAEAAARAQKVFAASDGSLLNQLEAARWIGASSVWGPSPTSETIRILREAVRRGDHAGSGLGLARMLFLQGRLDEAREEVERAAVVLREHGDRIMLSQADEVRAGIAEIEGDIAQAIRLSRAGYEGKTATGDVGFASTSAVNVALALIRAGEWDEAAQFASIAVETSSFDDIASQAGGKAAMARVEAHRGNLARAEDLAREAVAIMEETDYLDWHATIAVQLAHVLMDAGKRAEALETLRRARDLYDRKEAPVRVAEVDRLSAAWSG